MNTSSKKFAKGSTGSSLVSLLTAVGILGIVIIVYMQMSLNQKDTSNIVDIKVTRERLSERFDSLLLNAKARKQTITIARNPLLAQWAIGSITSLPLSEIGIEKPVTLYSNSGLLVVPSNGLLFDRRNKPTTDLSKAAWKVEIVWKEESNVRQYKIFSRISYLGPETGIAGKQSSGVASSDNELRCFSVVGPETDGPPVGTPGYSQQNGTSGRPSDASFTVATVECPVGSFLTGVYLRTGCNGETQHSYPDDLNPRRGICRGFKGQPNNCGASTTKFTCRASCCFFQL